MSILDTISTNESNDTNETITLLKSEALSADSNNSISFLAKTVVRTGIGLTSVVVLLLLML